ncbi:EAL domain-containing protein [Sulfurimonas sp.]
MEKAELKALINQTSKLTILVVEDDATTREPIVDFLDTFFENIFLANNGDEGLKLYNQEAIDIVFTDINMPSLNGLELIQKIREESISIPIVILSAHTEADYFTQSIKYGVDGYLLKPFDMQQFLAVISKVVKRINADRELEEYKLHLQEIVAQKTQELEHRCLHEYYTDLPNAIMLQDDLENKEYSYMLLLDISHFSVINKEYGKEFANHVIITTARTLEYHIHKDAKLYKTESDRFVILLKNKTLQDVSLYCDQIVSFFDMQNIQVDTTEIHITFNIGVDKVRENVSDTLIHCEYALDKSKELGSRHYEFFNDTLSAFMNEKEALKWLELTRELVLQEAIEPYFQPIINLKTGEIYKYEALARGVYQGDVIAPIHFIEPSEKLGLSTAVTRMMINKTFAFFQNKTEEFSINLTQRDMLEGYLVAFLQEKMKQYNIEAKRVTFEILENITIAKNSQKITKELCLLQELGFRIAVDDFGIENSNFSRLLEIQLDFIKIDGLFIKDLKQNERNRTITRAIVNLAKTLGIKTVAEYVEDEEIYEIIKNCGIDYAQGYYIGRPSPQLVS